MDQIGTSEGARLCPAIAVPDGPSAIARALPRKMIGAALAAARRRAASFHDGIRQAIARAMTFAAAEEYWRATQATSSERWPIAELPERVALKPLSQPDKALARGIGSSAAALDVAEASYWIGSLYTAMLPPDARSELGVYYTPPALCERLLDMVEEAGIDWRCARVLDPACGGGAFLSPVARRMADSLAGGRPARALETIAQRLRGFEIDPFAAWMSQVFLEVTLGHLCRSAGRRLPPMVEVCDSLNRELDDSGFDLVIGNPPYGRVTLAPPFREKYRRSLYGHANQYGLFTDLALRLTRPGGTIAYVTPASFLAGGYFKALRGLLAREAPPASIDFVAERKGVFADVLQETLLAVYRRGDKPKVGQVRFISPGPDGEIKATPAGSFRLPLAPEQPWLIPRAKAHTKLIRAAGAMRHRLADYGYRVSTGPLVWNRHKRSLRDRPGNGRYPLIWAESVRTDGRFEFRAQKRNHEPYFEPLPDETWVVTSFPCVLLQRTTAKEQPRRLIAAELPDSFVRAHGGVVVENHLNMIYPVGTRSPSVSPAAIAALLNTAVVDQLFRCVNGSVAVSAFELEALPLPPPESLAEIERLIRLGAKPSAVEQAARRLYRVGEV